METCYNRYRLPIDRRSIKEIITNKSPAHTEGLENAVDFICDIGTPIYAAASGTVVWLKDDSDEGGPSPIYGSKGNRLVIRHANGEYTAYEHLKHKGAIAKVGENVLKRQVVAYSGNTGYSYCPHLHFEVFNDPDDDESCGITLKYINGIFGTVLSKKKGLFFWNANASAWADAHHLSCPAHGCALSHSHKVHAIPSQNN